MVGAMGTTDGERVVVSKVRPKGPPPDYATIAAALLWQMRREGLTPTDIHRVIVRMPRSERSVYRRCDELAGLRLYGEDD